MMSTIQGVMIITEQFKTKFNKITSHVNPQGMAIHVTHPFSGFARRSLTKTNRKMAYNLQGSASNKFTKFHSNRMSGLARHKVRTTHTNKYSLLYIRR
jgi:hypothetical protein